MGNVLRLFHGRLVITWDPSRYSSWQGIIPLVFTLTILSTLVSRRTIARNQQSKTYQEQWLPITAKLIHNFAPTPLVVTSNAGKTQNWNNWGVSPLLPAHLGFFCPQKGLLGVRVAERKRWYYLEMVNEDI